MSRHCFVLIELLDEPDTINRVVRQIGLRNRRLTRVRGVPLAGEALGCGQPAHTGRDYTTDPTTVKGINPLGDPEPLRSIPVTRVHNEGKEAAWPQFCAHSTSIWVVGIWHAPQQSVF